MKRMGSTLSAGLKAKVHCAYAVLSSKPTSILFRPSWPTPFKNHLNRGRDIGREREKGEGSRCLRQTDRHTQTDRHRQTDTHRVSKDGVC